MEKSDRTLIPEWLRNSVSPTTGTVPANHPPPDNSLAHSTSRNKSLLEDDFFNVPYERGASNGIAKPTYNKFGRVQQDKDWERNKDKFLFGHQRDLDHSRASSNWDVNCVKGKSQPVLSKKCNVMPGRVAVNSQVGNNLQNVKVGGLNSRDIHVGNNDKISFERDFPCLGGKEKRNIYDKSTFPFGLKSTQSLLLGDNHTFNGTREQWSSALAEVKTVVATSNPEVDTLGSPPSCTPSGVSGLNMAEALTHPLMRPQSSPQPLTQTQKLEELAIRQSRQLIPMTPSMPKNAVTGSEKSKPKLGRSIESNIPAKPHQHSTSLFSSAQSLSALPAKSDTTKTTHGKLFVLKPSREGASAPSNGATANSESKVVSAQPPLLPFAPMKNQSVMKPSLQNKERKPSSQTQSRIDFFNLLKKKTSVNTCNSAPDVSYVNCDKALEGSNSTAPDLTRCDARNERSDLVCNGSIHEEVQKLQIFSEEEAAFLRSLGWEESLGEDEGLTEEEINSFYQEHMKMKPSAFRGT